MNIFKRIEQDISNQYGFLLNIVLYLIAPILILILFVNKFYENKKIVDDLATEYNVKDELVLKIKKFINNLPELLSKDELTLTDLNKFFWTKEKELLNKINIYEEQKINAEIKCYTAKLFVELLILIIIIWHWKNKSKENNYSIIIVLYAYILVKGALFYVSTAYPSMNSFVLSEVVTSEIDTDKDNFIFGNSMVNMVTSIVYPYAVYNIIGFKNLYVTNQFPWHIILISTLLIYSIFNTIFNLNRLLKWTHIEDNNINKIRLLTILLMKENIDTRVKEKELQKKGKIPEGLVDNTIYISKNVVNDIVNKINKPFTENGLEPSFKRVGNLLRDTMPPIYPSQY